ncbi:MAG: GNAT family N-acetyltransferase [Vulcanimicrobiaceae bacterium]
MEIRPIVPDDGDAYRMILEDTSEEDRYCRFFHAVDHFEPEFIEESVNRPDAIGFIAFEGAEPLGTAHAIAIGDGAAELAVIVARNGRRCGVAHALVERIIDESRKRDYNALVGYALRMNLPFSRLARSFGMVPDPMSDGATVTWRLDLQATRSPSAVR